MPRKTPTKATGKTAGKTASKTAGKTASKTASKTAGKTASTTAASVDTCDVTIRNAVAIVTMNRPDVHNSFDETLIARLTGIFTALDDDPDVRAVVLLGAGRSACRDTRRAVSAIFTCCYRDHRTCPAKRPRKRRAGR
jgi:hypothetical protein